jgi:hypothetical protein
LGREGIDRNIAQIGAKADKRFPFRVSILVIGGLQEWEEFADEGSMPQPERFEDLVFGLELVEEAENER